MAVAFFRAAGALLSDRKLRGPDFLAARLIPWSPHPSALVKVPFVRRLTPRLAERVAPGGIWFENVRIRYMDDVVRSEVADGARQVVILGAGLDSRPYRMISTLAATTVFEVDQPNMSVHKQQRVRELFAGDLPRHVRYVPADLEVVELPDVLVKAGFDPTVRTVVVWSGVTVYLEPAAVAKTLRWAAGLAKGSCLVFDYCWQETVDGTTTDPAAIRTRAAAEKRGEPWRFGIGRGAAKDYLAEHDLTTDEDVTVEELREKYLKDPSLPIWAWGGFVKARPRTSGN